VGRDNGREAGQTEEGSGISNAALAALCANWLGTNPSPHAGLVRYFKMLDMEQTINTRYPLESL